jgi:DNA primase
VAQRRVDASVPFVRLRVERELDAGDLSTAEGKGRVIDALRPVFAAIPPNAIREQLFALVADRTDLAPALVASRLARPGRGRPEPVPGGALAGIRTPASPPGRRPDSRPGRARNAPSPGGASPCRAPAARSA